MKRKNYHLFKIKGVNQERFFNALSKSFFIFDVDRTDKTHCSFKVLLKDKDKVRSLIQNNGFMIEEEFSKGPIYSFFKFFSCYGILAAICLCSIFYFLQSFRIERIEVWGDCDQALVQEYIENNLNTKYKNKIDCQSLERSLSDHFENFSFVSVAVVGQTLVVNVKTSIIPPEMDNEFESIISEYDGIVREINLIQGTLKVEVGDIIQKGQILVEGKVVNSEGEVFNLEPKAEIVLEIWAEGESTHFDEELVTARTGKKEVVTSVVLFGQEFYTNKKQISFSQYEMESFSKPLTKNNILPFILTENIYYETKTEKVVSNFEDVKDDFINQAKENCLQNLSSYAIIKSENYKIIEGAGCTTVKYVITASLKVS